MQIILSIFIMKIKSKKSVLANSKKSVVQEEKEARKHPNSTEYFRHSVVRPVLAERERR